MKLIMFLNISNNLIRQNFKRVLGKALMALGTKKSICTGTCCKSQQDDSNYLLALEEKYLEFSQSCSSSLLKKHLTKSIYDKLKCSRTCYGSTLLDCVRSGFENPDSGVGIYAADPECYEVFSPIFDSVIEEYHLGFSKCSKHPAPNWLDENQNLPNYENLDPCGEYIKSIRIRTARSLQGYPFNPKLTECQYGEIQQLICNALSNLKCDLQGNYYKLTDMSRDTKKELIENHYLFKDEDRFLESANARNFWPKYRGIFYNIDKTFIAWCNEEDHLRLISMENGCDFSAIYRRLYTAVQELECCLQFQKHPRLGYLNFCPTNIGSAIRASVHVRLPRLSSNQQKLHNVAGSYHLQVRGTRGEHSEVEDGVYELSNKRRLGVTEYEAFNELYNGISEIISLENIY